MKFSFIVGNGNQGHMLKMCLYSFMKYNEDHVDEIVISDNSSTDYTVEFLKENKYQNITKVLTYDIPAERNQCLIAFGIPWDMGLQNCKNEYAILSHVDVEWRGNYLKHFIDTAYDKKPFLFGYGGDDRIQEWGMIIHVPTWKNLGVSFGGITDSGISYDTGCFLFKKAVEKKLLIIPTNIGHWDNNEFFVHYIAGSRFRKDIITEIAMKYNEGLRN